MGAGIQIADGAAGSNKLGVNANGDAGVVIYDENGNPASVPNKGVITVTQPGIILMGTDYKIARAIRSSPDGTLRTGEDMPLLYDSIEGAAVDTNKWVQTSTTQTITQAVATGTLFNAGSSVATTTGAMHASHRKFTFINRNAIVFRAKQRHTTHFSNSLIELGFANPPAAATTAQVPDGAIWRKDGTGQYLPVVCINGSDVVGTAISNATFVASVPATDYCFFSIMLEEGRATFRITTQAGVIVNEQVIEFGTTIGTFSVTHLSAFMRHYNSGGTGTAVQVFNALASVWQIDAISPPFQNVQAGMNYGSLTSPTAFTQNANYANSAAPASATLSNTAAGYTTLGGQWQFAAVASAETDFALFAFTVPSPYAFVCTGVSIAAFNTGAANAAALTVLQWGLGFNSSAVSLATGAPYTPMRKTIGSHTFVTLAAIGASGGPDVRWSGIEVVQPGRFLHIILKVQLGTATASQVIRGTCTIDGYFE